METVDQLLAFAIGLWIGQGVWSDIELFLESYNSTKGGE